jgi:DnaD/phage-associated family protein
MPRPVKHTAEYFSHDADASSGRTLSILFNHFGHEGLSAWWQLLERISSTDNHVIDTRNPESFEYLASVMRFKPERLKAILDKMAELEAIDPELYQSGLIWSQNFVDRLEPLYKTRKQQLPTRPTLLIQETPLISKETPLIISEIPQSKLKETKLKEREEEKEDTAAAGNKKAAVKKFVQMDADSIEQIPVAGADPAKSEEPGSDNSDYTAAVDSEQNSNLAAIVLCYEQNIGMLTPAIAEELDELAAKYSAEWFNAAVKEAAKSNARRLNYVIAILERWQRDGFKASSARAPGRSSPGSFSDPDKFIKGKYGNVVQR